MFLPRILALPLLVAVTLSPAGHAREPDLLNGEDINQVCAGCHGINGEGGKDGEYPRIAGQPYRFLYQQMILFQERHRPNLAMIEHVDKRQMPPEDVQDISAYLAAIDLPTRLDPVDENAPGFDALARLQAARQVMQIPLAEGDIDVGGRLYRRECASCHGRDGMGDPDGITPMLAGQYTAYLWRQVPKYIDKVRIHDPDAPEDPLLEQFSEVELRDIFAYLSTLDD
jgi:cytochrome c553